MQCSNSNTIESFNIYLCFSEKDFLIPWFQAKSTAGVNEARHLPENC